jgi:RHS repeat-associated protein
MNSNLRKYLTFLLIFLASGLTRADLVGTVTYYHTNLVGSPVAATSSSGSLLWTTDYLPYGEKYATDTNAKDNKVWFTGHVQDAPAGLIYMQARYYDPDAGRFMGVDPSEVSDTRPQTFNRYAYSNNNPYLYSDPDGKDPVIGMTVGAIAGAVYGYLGAYHAGGSQSERVISAATGLVFGAALGAADPSLGVGTLAFIGGASAGASDIMGQMIAHDEGSKKPLINPGSTIGAVAGGALGGAGSFVFGPLAAGTGFVSETVGTAAVSALTSGPGVLTTGIGSRLGEAVHEELNTPLRRHTDSH